MSASCVPGHCRADEYAASQRQPRGGELTGELAFARVAPGEHRIKETPRAEVQPGVAVAVCESGERERKSSEFEHRRSTRGVGRARECGERAPPGALRLDRHAGGAVWQLGLRTAHKMLRRGPVLQHRRIIARPGDHAVTRVFEHDRSAEGGSDAVNDVVDRAAVQAELREHRVHLGASLERLVLRREHPLVHPL